MLPGSRRKRCRGRLHRAAGTGFQPGKMQLPLPCVAGPPRGFPLVLAADHARAAGTARQGRERCGSDVDGIGAAVLPRPLHAELGADVRAWHQGQGGLQVDQVGRRQQAGFAEIGGLREQRVEGLQPAVAQVVVAAGDVGFQADACAPRPCDGAIAGIAGHGPCADGEVAGRAVQRAALQDHLRVPVPRPLRAVQAHAEAGAALVAAGRGETRAVAAVAEQVRFDAAARSPRPCGPVQIGANQIGTAVAAVVEGPDAIVHRPQRQQVQPQARALPRPAQAVERQPDVGAVAHGDQPRTAQADFLPAHAQARPRAPPGQIALLEVQRAAVGTAGAAVAPAFAMHAELGEGLPAGMAQVGRKQCTQQAVIVAGQLRADAGRVVMQAAQAQRGVQGQRAIAGESGAPPGIAAGFSCCRVRCMAGRRQREADAGRCAAAQKAKHEHPNAPQKACRSSVGTAWRAAWPWPCVAQAALCLCACVARPVAVPPT